MLLRVGITIYLRTGLDWKVHMTANHALCEWNKNWRLIANEVVCRACGASQIELGGNRLFTHHPGCANKFLLLPWSELYDIVEKVSNSCDDP